MKLEIFLEKVYEKNYKKLIFISLGLLILSIVILGINYASKGSIIERDISLKGGISITIEKESLNENEISSLKDTFVGKVLKIIKTNINSGRYFGKIF